MSHMNAMVFASNRNCTELNRYVNVCETIIGYRFLILAAYLFGIFPSTLLPHLGGSSHRSLVDIMGIIHVAPYVYAVRINVKVHNTTPAVTVKCNYILAVFEIGCLCTFTLRLGRKVNRIKLTDKVICQPLPVLHCPTLCFLRGWGNLNTYHVPFERMITVQSVLKLLLQGKHSCPHCRWGNIIGQEIGLYNLRLVLIH